MKKALPLGLLVLLGLALVACGSEDNTLAVPETAAPAVVRVAAPSATPELGTPEPVVVEVVAPTDTPEPVRERPYRSYPAPTGYPGFRVYYQKRCYPGCHSYPTTPGLDEVSDVQPTEASSTVRERPYRSYPARQAILVFASTTRSAAIRAATPTRPRLPRPRYIPSQAPRFHL